MSLDQDKSFYCVVDGMVQVFAETDSVTRAPRDLWDDGNFNGFQLLNEVGSGGMLSSLFTILSLFTEDVKMSWQDPIPDPSQDFGLQDRLRRYSDVSQQEPKPKNRTSSASSVASTSTVHPGGLLSADSVRSGSVSPSMHEEPLSYVRPSVDRATDVHGPSIHRGIIARATEDTTLAVIPAEAFRRLTKNFPKATGHIVQGASSRAMPLRLLC